ncbi:MAG: alanine racemase [Betaproteobacteria bacterium]|nr:alanine racemase [Betaproteobacteria bacterium]
MSSGLDAMSLVRPNRFEIDLKAIARCVQNVRKTIGPSIHFFATLKANAYGYGLLPAAKTVVGAGADAISPGYAFPSWFTPAARRAKTWSGPRRITT